MGSTTYGWFGWWVWVWGPPLRPPPPPNNYILGGVCQGWVMDSTSRALSRSSSEIVPSAT
jgi:hypothetical protein